MRFTPVFLFLLLSLNVFSQGYSLNWAKSIGSTSDTIDEVSIYPSPFTDKLTIDGLQGTFFVEIVNSLGQVVHREKSSTEVLDLAHLPKGIYYVRIAVASFSYKVIKQ